MSNYQPSVPRIPYSSSYSSSPERQNQRQSQSHSSTPSSSDMSPSEDNNSNDGSIQIPIPEQAVLSSRRPSTSIGSEPSTSHRYKPSVGYTPLPLLGDFSRTSPSRPGSASDDHRSLSTETVAEKYSFVPTDDFLLYVEQVEKDDHLHDPEPCDHDISRDRVRELWNPRSVNLVCLGLLLLGFLMLFFGWPVIKWKTPVYKEVEGQVHETCTPGESLCLDVGPKSLLKNLRTSPIDPDTPESAKTMIGANGKKLKLVFSDEFNKEGRTFYDDDDPYFQGVDLWYGVTQDLEWYDPDAITTKNGALEIRFDSFPNHGLKYRSGMLQSWNKLCFTGGHLEASISLPGRGDVSGFWPGFWAMGNLGRPGYAATTEGMWPYSYHDECDVGITANQSQMDGISWLPGMRLPACPCKGEDHPTPGKSRSAPEIDVIEASVSPLNGDNNAAIGTVSQSLQIAPYDVFYMPNLDFAAVYNEKITHINDWRGGPYQQSMSGLSNLNNNWYDGKAYQTYALDYTPGPQGTATWYIGKDKTWTLDSRALSANGNIGQRTIPMEPMSIIMNLGMGDSFAMINQSIHELMPAYMRFDYIRIYQDPNDDNDGHGLTCDPPGRETTRYIEEHRRAYSNPNLTSWSGAGYDWPKNTFVHGCK